MNGLVVVGVDGSFNADAALSWALTYARRTEATVRVVTAWGWDHVVGVPGARFPTETLEQAEARAHGVVTAALERMDRELVEGAKIEHRIAQGPASRVLLDAAEDADLLVIGSRGLGPLRGQLLGSVSQQVVRHATCPTVVIPHPDGMDRP